MATSRRIGFVSTRFSGTDGVSLETQKWADVLERMGNQCFYFCGECDRPQEISHVVPEAFYRHPRIDAINQVVFTGEWGKIHEAVEPSDAASNLHQDFFSIFIRPRQITEEIQELRILLKKQLYNFAQRFSLEALIVENALTIPVNIPWGWHCPSSLLKQAFP